MQLKNNHLLNTLNIAIKQVKQGKCAYDVIASIGNSVIVIAKTLKLQKV